MTRNNTVYIGHMLDAARSVVTKVEGIDRVGFDQDENLRFASVYLIQVIGEAAARVTDDFRDLHREIPWREIVGMRHRIVHDYMHVDFDIVWGVATNRLPTLITQLEQIMAE